MLSTPYFQRDAVVSGRTWRMPFAAGLVLGGFLSAILGGGWSLWLERGGAADCTANLFYFGWKAGKQTYNKLATTYFAAGG